MILEKRKTPKIKARHSRDLKLLAIRRLGGKCVRCGFSDYRALQFDHIEGKGWTRGGNNNFLGCEKRYSEILSGDSEGIQLLCSNCNWIKKVERGEGCYPDLNEFFLEAMRKDGVDAVKPQRQVVAALGGSPSLVV